MFYIYLTTNLINNKKYIGQHKGKENDNYLGSGTLITKAIEKYGKENFSKEILKICENQEEADFYERLFIKQFNAVEDDNFYNLSEGGTGGDGWRSYQRWKETHPDEVKKQYEENAKRLKQWEKDNPEKFQELVVKPMLQGSKKWREENREEVLNNMKKVNEAKEKWQKEHPEEHQKQVKEWIKAGSIANSQKVICTTTGEIFQSQSEAARYYNIPQANISKCLKKERKSAGKHPETNEKLVWALFENE